MIEDAIPFDILVIGGIWVVAMLGATVLLTTVYSVYAHRKDDKYDAVAERMRSELFDHLERESPDWDALIARITETERQALRELLRDHLEMLKGPERDELEQLGVAMGIDEWALDRLENGYDHHRLLALDWLELLGVRVPPRLLFEKCIGEPELEAAGAHLLLTDDPASARTPATKLLLSAGTPMSIRGMDALHAVYELEPERLLAYVEEHASGWEQGLLGQVLEVLAAGATADPETSLEWIIELLDHDDPRVRAATLAVLQPYEWRPDVRSAVDLERMTRDPSDRVRKHAYTLLGAWGGDENRQILQEAIKNESSHRARVAGVRALIQDFDRSTIPFDPPLERAWNWVEANAAISSR